MKAFIAGTLLLMGGTAFGQQVNLTPSNTNLTWEGSKVVGGSHQGTLDVKNGHVQFKNNEPHSAEVVVDMKSLKNSDLADPKWNKKLVGHLHSDDFFSTAAFPESKIVITKFSNLTKGAYKISGKLTIKGITKDVNFTGKVSSKDDSRQTLTADLDFDRTDFNIRYGSGKFFDNLGDKMISDKVQVQITVELDKTQTVSM